jgi:hypothetical protein
VFWIGNGQIVGIFHIQRFWELKTSMFNLITLTSPQVQNFQTQIKASPSKTTQIVGPNLFCTCDLASPSHCKEIQTTIIKLERCAFYTLVIIFDFVYICNFIKKFI